MSFILDALKKAEHARPAASMPQMPAVSVAASGLSKRQGLPGWTLAAAGALAMLLLVAAGWQIVRDSGEAPAVTRPAATEIARSTAEQSAFSAAGGAAQATAPAAEAAAPRRAEVRPLDSEARAGQPVPDAVAQSRSAAPATVGSGSAARRDGKTTPGTVVYEPDSPAPSTEGGSVQYQRNFGNEPAPVNEEQTALPQASAPDDSGPPSYNNVKLRGGGVPELHMDIHVFSRIAENRFVFVNSRKYRQGQTTREGVLIEEITPTGATMSFRGKRFEMARN